MLLLSIVGCTAMGGLLSYTLADRGGMTEAGKMQRVAARCGLMIKEQGKTFTIHLLRRSRHSWGTEYVYRIPLGLSFDDFLKKQHYLEDGLNHKRGFFDLTLDDIKTLRFRSDLLEQIKKLLNGDKGRKEIMLEYDGTLKVKVYHEALPELYQMTDEVMVRCRGWSICMGQAREGVIYHDFDKIPHMVAAGTTRYGKSVFLKNIITTLIHNHANAVKLTLLDLKGGLAFNRFKNCRQVETVAKDVTESLSALKAVHAAILSRQRDYLSRGHEDIREAKEKTRHFIIVDEAAELASKGEGDPALKGLKVQCEHILAEIARIGGGLGFRLIFATQYPTADTLPRQIKQNCDARLCFRLQTDVASQVVLDEAGAEDLPLIKGRAIYQTDRKLIMQTPMIENAFIDRTIGPHIVIKSRKEEEITYEGRATEEAPAGRIDTLIVEEV